MVCPNCGAPLPDTAKMCYICKFQFDQSLPESEKNTSELKWIPTPLAVAKQNAANTNGASMYQNSNANNTTQRFISSPLNRKQISISCYLGLAGALIVALSVFAPFVGATALFQTVSVSFLDSGMENTILVWFDCLLILLWSIPSRKYCKGDGIGKIIIGVFGVGCFLYNAISISTRFRASDVSNYAGLSFQLGFFLIVVGYIIILASGVLLTKAVPKKK